MTYVLGKTSLAKLEGVNQRLVSIVKEAITLSSQDFSVNMGVRTAKEQHALYLKGRSQLDGYKKKSNHQPRKDGLGYAVDLVPYVNGKLVWDWDLIYPIAVAMSTAAANQGAIIRWGGNWYETMNQYDATLDGVKEAVERYKRDHPGTDFIDGPHFELIK